MSESERWPRIAVLGPGLLGGSLALALRERGCGDEVVIWGRRKEAVDEALELGVCDRASIDVGEVIDGADVVVLATPVPVMGEVFARGADFLKPGCLVTDVGSVKVRVVEDLEKAVEEKGGVFVGGHPMAGSEHSGIRHSRADLFEGAACILTPGDAVGEQAVARVRGFWESVGCRVSLETAGRHDALVARISHMPHAVASAVVNVALGADAGIAGVAGAGFRDTTRVAGGDPGMWRGILEENRAAVVPVLRELCDELGGLVRALEGGDGNAVSQFLDRAKKLRQGCSPRDLK